MADAEGAARAVEEHVQRERAGLCVRCRDVLVVQHDAFAVAAAGAGKHMFESESTHLDGAPRLHVLASHAIAKGMLPFEHDDVETALCEYGCECSPGDPTADNDDIDDLGHQTLLRITFR